MRPRTGGFTLLETLVALSVTAVVLMSLATAVPTLLRTRGAATAALERATTTRSVLLHLERELAGTLREPFRLQVDPDERLEFTGGQEPGERLVYAVEHGVLVRRTGARVALEPPGHAVPVLDGVARWSLEAWDGRAWVTRWDSTELPQAVRIRLDLADGGTVGMVAPIPSARRRLS